MTIKELTRELTLIGHDAPPYSEEAITNIANRALEVIFSEHSVRGEHILEVDPQKSLPNGRKTAHGVAIIDLKEQIDDLFSVEEVRSLVSREPLGFVEIRDTRLYLPACFSGELLIVYRKSAERITGADEEINIPPRLSPLLPLLCASFAWAEELPELSDRYLNVYRELSDTVRKEVRAKLSPAYAHNGWA